LAVFQHPAKNAEKEVLADAYNPQEDVSTRIRAQEVICACPRIFTRRMIVG
jgi:hypothetical protein